MPKTQFIYLNIVCFAFIASLLISCNKKSNKILDSGKILSIKVGSEYTFTGLVNIADANHLCFVKQQFTPSLKIFNANGVLTDSISLVEAETQLGNITHVWVSSVDSVYAYSSYSGLLVLIDKNGLLISQKYYNNLSDHNGNYYELYMPYSTHLFTPTKNKNIFFRTYIGDGDSTLTNIQRLDNIRKKGFLICKVNSPSQEEEIDYIFGFRFSDIVEFAELSDVSVCFDPLYYTLMVNNRIFLLSEYSRYIYELSDSLTVKNKIQVIDYKSAIIQPLFVKPKDNMQAKTDEILLHFVKAKAVTNILYNPIVDSYLVIIKNGEVKNRNWHNYPFKIQLYDQNFVKIKEIEIDSYDYVPRKSFIMNGKLYIQKENKSHNTKDYEVIEF